MKKCFFANANLKSEHQYGSYWYQWPWMEKGMSYWSKNTPDGRSYQQIFLGGNFFVFGITTPAVICYLAYVLSCMNQDDSFSKRQIFYGISSMWMILGFILNWLPYMKISRVCFLYHYVPSLYFGVLLASLMLDKYVRDNLMKLLLVSGILLLSIAYFIWQQYAVIYVYTDSELITQNA